MTETTYSLISLIINGIAALGTVSAVIFALFQFKFANKKESKIKFNKTFILVLSQNYTSKGQQKYHCYFRIDITNIGNKNFIIALFELYLSKENSIQITDLSKSNKLLIKLEETESFYADPIELRKIISSEKGKIKNLNRKIKFIFTDTTGKKYKIKINMTYNDLLNSKDSDYIK